MSETTANDPTAIAARLFTAIEAGDIDAVREAYHPDVVIWHNDDGVEQSRDTNLRTLAWVTKHIDGMRYDDVRLTATPTGFVQQHVVRGSNRAGVEVAMPACIVVTLDNDGLITRLDEYLDSRHVDLFTQR